MEYGKNECYVHAASIQSLSFRQTDRQANKDVIYYDRDRDGTQNVCECVFLIIALLQPSFLPFNNLWNKAARSRVISSYTHHTPSSKYASVLFGMVWFCSPSFSISVILSILFVPWLLLSLDTSMHCECTQMCYFSSLSGHSLILGLFFIICFLPAIIKCNVINNTTKCKTF